MASAGIRNEQSFDVKVQVIDLSRARADWLDPRLRCPEMEALARSEALIVNIDYPWAWRAYHHPVAHRHPGWGGPRRVHHGQGRHAQRGDRGCHDPLGRSR